MKLYAILLAMLFTVSAHASDFLNVLDISQQCNNGHVITKIYAQPGISETSCVMNATRIAPGFDLYLQTDYPSFFFFDTFVYIKINNKDVPLRFVVYEDEKDYNAIQAIVQTAYAKHSAVSVIFANPMLPGNLYDFKSFFARRKTEKICYTNNDLNGEIAFVNCSIQAIQLSSN